MSEPRFGNCRDCAAWVMSKVRVGRGPAKECRRYAALGAPTNAHEEGAARLRAEADLFSHGGDAA